MNILFLSQGYTDQARSNLLKLIQKISSLFSIVKVLNVLCYNVSLSSGF